jgi:hypothetical protein
MNPHDPTDPDFLTRPERAAAREQAKPLRDKVIECGGCTCCKHRDRATEGPTRAACGLSPPQAFPKCDFDPDHDRLYSRENLE